MPYKYICLKYQKVNKEKKMCFCKLVFHEQGVLSISFDRKPTFGGVYTNFDFGLDFAMGYN